MVVLRTVQGHAYLRGARLAMVSTLPEWVALDGDPLDAIGGGDRIGYARVSTPDQLLRRQVDALAAAICSAG